MAGCTTPSDRALRSSRTSPPWASRSGLIVTHQPFTVVDSAISWSVAAALALAPMRARYLTSIGYHRERMEWFGIGVTLAATVALVATVLHLLVGWPGPLGAVAAGATVLVPVGFLAAESRRLGPYASRGLVQVLSVFGFVVVVSAIYLVVVLGVGHTPKTTGDKEALALALVASGVGRAHLRAGAHTVPPFRHALGLRVAGGAR